LGSPPSHTLDALLANAVARGVAPGVVAMVASGRENLYAGAAGIRARDAQSKIEVDSIFRVASMTKLVTSLAVMMLVEDRRVDLDEAFVNYVPGYKQPEVLQSFDANTRSYTTRPAGSAVTVRQLLTHTSGYGYWFLHAPLLLLTSGAPNLLDPPFLMYPPGQRFAYGSSTDVLGQIIAPVTGLTLESFFAQRIFEPLGMVDTGFRIPTDPERLVTRQARRDGGFVEIENETSLSGVPTGGTGLYSTAPDYMRLLRLFLSEGELDERRLLAPDNIAAITRNQIGDLQAERQQRALAERTNDFIFMDGSQRFGFGVLIETSDRAAGRAAGTFSWGGIFNTYFWVDPRADLAAVLLMQTSPFADPESVALLESFERAAYSCYHNRA
jgi:CubicO group peptidase (beta-lactamase class C family)